MSMQSWGSWEILLDMDKAKSVAQSEYNIMERLIEEEDPFGYQLENQEDISDELISAIEMFRLKILSELEIEIYLRYISSEAEGTDLAGESIWCIEPEYQSQVYNAMADTISWSEFG